MHARSTSRLLGGVAPCRLHRTSHPPITCHKLSTLITPKSSLPTKTTNKPSTSRISPSFLQPFNKCWYSTKSKEIAEKAAAVFPSGLSGISNTSTKSPFESVIPIDRDVITVSAYDDTTCTLNGIVFFGSVLVFPTIAFMVDIPTFEDITIEKLALAFMFKPKIDYLIIGCGAGTKRFEQSFYDKIYEKYGVVAETMSTAQAMGTYNFCTEDGRRVGALFITPKPYPVATERVIYTPREIAPIKASVLNTIPNTRTVVQNRVVK
eukprot:Phypoly_transcript_13708.p1 GENE.Phypoly_transcript_13708~~Phypoly_transcript_13708.p1  ORF type:complete len:264 (+),score=26.67 Phypoly_transcript_13708:151-942(+)